LHGGADQIIEIEIFDVEFFADVRAAVAQQLHDLALVIDWVKLCSHRIGASRNLTQRKRGGEHFDEDQVH
jgi:hypothetical protein